MTLELDTTQSDFVTSVKTEPRVRNGDRQMSRQVEEKKRQKNMFRVLTVVNVIQRLSEPCTSAPVGAPSPNPRFLLDEGRRGGPRGTGPHPDSSPWSSGGRRGAEAGVVLAVLRVAARRVLLATARRVRLGVLGQVVGAHEALVARGAREPLLARVSPQVALQLVGAREALAAEEPVTDEGPLAGVPTQVSLEVRGLVVHLPAPRDVAAVDVALPQVLPGGAQAVSLVAVGAVARGPARVTAGGAGTGQRGSGQEGADGGGGGQRVGLGGQDPLVGVLEQVLALRQQRPGAGGQRVAEGARVVGVAGHVELGVQRGGVGQPVARPGPVSVVGGGRRVHVPPRRRPVHRRHVHLRRRLEALGARVGRRQAREGPGLVVARDGGHPPVHAAEAGRCVVAQARPFAVHLLQEGRLHSNNHSVTTDTRTTPAIVVAALKTEASKIT